MKPRTLIERGLRHYWRTHLGVVLGGAAGTAVLVGALVIGDSVRESLARTARARTGSIVSAMVAPDRFFRTSLAESIGEDLHTTAAPVLRLSGTLATDDGSVRIQQVQVLGVPEQFWWLGGAAHMTQFGSPPGTVILNGRAAARLGARPDEIVFLRFEKPGRLPGEAPFSGEEAGSVGQRLTVCAIADDDDFGRFSLTSTQVSPVTAFVPRAWLEAEVGLAGSANLLLLGGAGSGGPTAEQADAAFARHWQLADAGLELAAIPERNVFELRSTRVFLDPPVAEAAARASPDAVGVLTYLVNELRLGDRATPYSMVTAIGPLGQDKGSAAMPKGVLPPDMADDEIVINSWLADDLAAKPGDALELQYFVLGPTGALSEASSRLRVRSVVPLESDAADRTLMPDFPGLASATNCRDWKPGIPIDTRKIRPKDEEYWAQIPTPANPYRGTPKAFVALAAGQKMWANRFGNLTAVRFPSVGRTKSSVASAVRRELRPADLGLFFQPVGGAADANPTTDFGQLFLGFSFFLIVAAMLLVGLLFAFGVEQRAAELGTLLALGIPRRRVRRLMLLEGGALALVGSLAGLLVGTLYTRAMLLGLATVWSDAVGATRIHYHAEATTLVAGAAAGVVIALVTIWLSVRRLVRRPARELLALGAGLESGPPARVRGRGRLGLAIAVGSVLGAGVLVILGAARRIDLVLAFMGAGTLLLVAGLAFSRAILIALARTGGAARLTLAGLGLRNVTRRRGRSLATVALLACGAFLVVAIGANRHDPAADARRRSAGTGGFALFGESSLPVTEDLNTDRGRQAFGLPAAPLEGVAVVPLRVRRGDDASCLNLSRARQPSLVGVRPEALASRGAFTFVKTLGAAASADGSAWLLLDRPQPDGVVPAIGDDTMITWSLGKSVGDTIDYTDDRGRTFRVRLVGALANSILQGGLVISERDFVARFPSESGYRMFLVDAPEDKAAAASKALSRGLEDVGLALTPAAQRLATFAAVENTYLSIFQVLGGLGMLLGSVGLGVVVLRNVLERRGELALLRAVGFSRGAVRWLVLSEHWGLLAMGLVCGVAAALVAVVPALASPRAPVPYASLAVTLAAVVANGALWTYLAALAALRGPLLAALRNE